MIEKLCIFCENFKWEKEYQWGTGSTMTGAMMTGGWAKCGKGHFTGYPNDEADYRRIILQGENCPDYDQVDMAPKTGVE